MLSLGDLLQTLDDPGVAPQAGSEFGRAVATDGNLTVVGVNSADLAGLQNVGRAYVFNSTTGALVATLDNPTPAEGDQFGFSVEVSGSTVVVGALGDDTGATDAGSAYIFDAATGNLLWTLNNPTPASSDMFGGVALSGSTVVVGVPYDDTGAWNAGSAYIFDAATGNLLWTLNNPTPAAVDYFGASVAMSGGTVVVGAFYDGTGANNAGSAYVFDAATGNLLWTLNNPTPADGDRFGAPVAVSGSTVVVGAPYDDAGAWDAGSAYIFDAATGNLLWTLANPTPASSDRFGGPVALSGSTVVVGAPYDDTGATDAGSAYLFDAATGNLLWTLANPTPANDDRFGSPVAVSGNTVVVGAPYDDAGAWHVGSAYLFDAATGNLLRTLNNPTPAAGDMFGRSVAVSGSTLVVGAPYDRTGATYVGSAYVFDAATGNLLWTLANPAPAGVDLFGESVAVAGGTVVVGAMGDDTGADDAGSAYLFDAGTGNLLRTLNNPTPARNDVFGYSVAVSGGMVVVGAPEDDTGAADAGSAYLFDAATGNLLRTLANPPPAWGDWFGVSVAVSGSTVVVGAWRDDTGGTRAGSAYLFDAATGNLLGMLANPTPANGDRFGSSVAVSGNTVVVGAPGEDGTTLDRGAAYVFDASRVAGRHLFYNNSKFDGHTGFTGGDPAANEFDDAAIDTAKEALLPGGGKAAFKNYSSFSRGVNGIMIDIAGLPGTALAATDFVFKYGNDDTPGDWLAAADPATIAARAGAGTGGSDRVTLVWPDNAIPNGNWLQVTVLANANTGLASPDVFYFGSAIGETGNTPGPTPPADARVNSSDVTLMRNNYSGFGTVGIESVYDINRDGKVNSSDVTIARNYYSGFTPLALITPPAPAPPAGEAGGAGVALSAGSGDPRRALGETGDTSVLQDSPTGETPVLLASAAARDAVFRQNLDRWGPELYADLAWSWQLALPRPRQEPSEGGTSTRDVRPWMLADDGR